MEKVPEWILVGRVAGPHGTHGDVAVKLHTDRPERFIAGARLYLKDVGESAYTETRVVAGRATHRGAVIRLEGTDSREDASRLTGVLLYIAADQLLPPEEGCYYGFQLEGCQVHEGGRLIGTVRGLKEGKANPYLEVEPAGGGEDILIPFVSAVVLAVDLRRRRIEIPAGFLG